MHPLRMYWAMKATSLKTISDQEMFLPATSIAWTVASF